MGQRQDVLWPEKCVWQKNLEFSLTQNFTTCSFLFL